MRWQVGALHTLSELNKKHYFCVVVYNRCLSVYLSRLCMCVAFICVVPGKRLCHFTNPLSTVSIYTSIHLSLYKKSHWCHFAHMLPDSVIHLEARPGGPMGMRMQIDAFPRNSQQCWELYCFCSNYNFPPSHAPLPLFYISTDKNATTGQTIKGRWMAKYMYIYMPEGVTIIKANAFWPITPTQHRRWPEN